MTVLGLAVVVSAAHFASTLSHCRRKPLTGDLRLTFGAALLLRPSAWPVIDLAVLAGAVGGVLWLERSLQNPISVVVFLCVAAAVDLLSASRGLTHMMVQRYVAGTSDLPIYLCLVIPVRGHTVPIIGIVDLPIGGTAAAALIRLRLPPAAVMGAVSAGLLSAIAFGLWSKAAVAALPFLGVAVSVLVWWHLARPSSIG